MQACFDLVPRRVAPRRIVPRRRLNGFRIANEITSNIARVLGAIRLPNITINTLPNIPPIFPNNPNVPPSIPPGPPSPIFVPPSPISNGPPSPIPAAPLASPSVGSFARVMNAPINRAPLRRNPVPRQRPTQMSYRQPYRITNLNA